MHKSMIDEMQSAKEGKPMTNNVDKTCIEYNCL
jgi:hypothetical protein